MSGPHQGWVSLNRKNLTQMLVCLELTLLLTAAHPFLLDLGARHPADPGRGKNHMGQRPCWPHESGMGLAVSAGRSTRGSPAGAISGICELRKCPCEEKKGGERRQARCDSRALRPRSSTLNPVRQLCRHGLTWPPSSTSTFSRSQKPPEAPYAGEGGREGIGPQ